MNWICNLIEHKPNREDEHYRERMPNYPFPEKNIALRVEWNKEFHYERYTTCTRCDTEISYVRWFNWWGDKDRVTDVGRDWLEKEDADRISLSASAEELRENKC